MPSIATPTPATAGAFTAINDAAAVVGLHPRTLRRAISNGELPAYKFGKALRIRVVDLDRWADSKRMPAARTLRPVRSGAR